MKKHLIKLLIFAIALASTTIKTSGAYFSDSQTVEGITITAGCWQNPSVPNLVYPSNNYVANITSAWMANPYMDWSDSTGCPGKTIAYQYESYHDIELSNLAYRSGSISISQIPAPGTPDGQYYWRVRAYDGTNWSGWSDVWHLTVDRSNPNPTPTPSAPPVVINEVMWMGTSRSGGNDEWIELKNTTGSDINLNGWKINLSNQNSFHSLSGTIPAGGYYLITENATNDSPINNSIIPDDIYKSISLPDGGRQLILKDSSSNIIDETPNGSWPAGLHDGGIRRSMERNDTPSDGTVAGNWHTCIDVKCNDTAYWDSEGEDYGTPKSANLSANDSSEVDLNFYKSDPTHLVFKLTGGGLNQYSSADYLITYDSDQTTQGITGHFDIEGRTEIITDGLFMGTCSTGGICTQNTGIENIKLTVTLSGTSQKVINSPLNF